MNVIARLEYELAYYDSPVHRFNHYTTSTPPTMKVPILSVNDFFLENTIKYVPLKMNLLRMRYSSYFFWGSPRDGVTFAGPNWLKWNYFLISKMCSYAKLNCFKYNYFDISLYVNKMFLCWTEFFERELFMFIK